MDFLEDLFEGLTERKKHGKHKHGHYANHDRHDYNYNQHRDKDAYQERCFCHKCSVEVQQGAKFCSNCGSAVNTAMNCSNCGVKLAPGVKFCSECGTSTK